MSDATKTGFLVVADITGYTAYLNHSELEHARDILKTLIELLIDHTRPPLALSGLEGDAVLSYTLDSDRFEGQAFVEMIEQTYVAFRKAIELMVMNTSCDCNACANITALDLKFFVHHGEFAIQGMRRGEELIGAEVNLIHRLMKNSVTATTGFKAYTLFTSSAIDRLGLEGITAGMTPHRESYEDIGDVTGWVLDMAPVWQAGKDEPMFEIDKSRSLTFVEEYPLPPEQIWGYLTNPEHRAVYSNAKRQVALDRVNGRVGKGTVYECYHGSGAMSTNTVLEWNPFERIVTEDTGFRSIRFLSVYEIERIPTGSRLTVKISPLPADLIDRALMAVFSPILKAQIRKGIGNSNKLIEDDIAEGRISVPEKASVSAEETEAALTVALASSSSG